MPFHIGEGRGGGAEVQAWLAARELARRGYEVSYIAQSVNGREGTTESRDGVRLSWVKYAHHFRWSNGGQYSRALAAERPDVVIQRGTSFVTGVAGRYCRSRGKTFAWICTDNEVPFRWYFLRRQFKENAAQGAGPFKGTVFLFNALLSDLSRHSGMKCVTRAFTQNDTQEGVLRLSYGMDSARMISGQEAPLEVLPPREKLAGGIVLWTAHLGEVKRPEEFVSLARLGAATLLRFVMVGGHSDSTRVENVFRDAPENLERTGKLPFDQALEWFDRAAFFVNTSRAEGFPNTYLQAWLRGVPVLSLGADPDGVIAREGLGVVAASVEEMAEAMKEMRASPEQYAELSRRVREYALRHHTVEAVADRLLEEVLPGGKGEGE